MQEFNTPALAHVAATRAFNPPLVLTPRQFHDAIQGVIGLNTVYELLRAQRIRHVRVGTRYLILASETTEFFKREAEGPWFA